MKSIQNEITALRSDSSFTISNHYNCRHAVVLNESDKSKTAYCFSVPIRNKETKNLVDFKFHHNNLNCMYYGSNSNISIRDSIVFQNQYGNCSISFQAKLEKKTISKLFFSTDVGKMEISPTLNGLYFKMYYSKNHFPVIKLTGNSPHKTKSNDKYFALMAEQFKPLITVSCIGTYNQDNMLIAPCQVQAIVETNGRYTLSITSPVKTGSSIAFEINMHEPKLLQDTTVESKHATTNNAYGGIAYLGNSVFYEEQWLYSRLEYTLLDQFQNKKIRKAILHLPNLNHSQTPLILNQTTTRFCSFGSNWNNKVPISKSVGAISITPEFYNIDLTSILQNEMNTSNNFVIRVKDQHQSAVMIPTADSYYHPQILELNFR